MENNKPLTSTYNQAVSQLIRLDRAWAACNHYSTSGELTKWKWQLDVLQRELICDCNLLDKNIKKNEDKFSTKISKTNEDIAQAKNKTKLYIALTKKEEILRILEDKAGKGSKRKIDEDEDYDL